MMRDAADRLARLRAALADAGLDGWYVGREDMFQGEEVPPSEERLAFVSGFSGSAGHAVILQDAAALFSDGRYTLQMINQSDPDLWSTHTLPEARLSTWLQEAGAQGKRIGVDPQLVTVAGFRRLEQACRDAGAELVPHADNPLDAVWGTERPQRGATQPFRMPDPVAGQSMADKLAALDKRLADAGADAVVISRVDAVNWLVNIRGNDLANTPVNLIFALYHRENGLLLLGDPASLAPVMEGDLVQQAAVVALDQFDALIHPRAGYDAGTAICFEPASLPQSMFAPLTESDARLVEADCAVTAMKAVKNSAELAGTRRAHVEDGAVMVRFLHWLSAGGADGMTETAIAAHLLTLRQASPRFIASSFDAICGRGQMVPSCITGPLPGRIGRCSRIVCCWLIPVRITMTAQPTLPGQWPSAPPMPRCATPLPPSCVRILLWHGRGSRQGRPASKSMRWPARQCGQTGWIMRMAPGTGSGMCCRSMKVRPAFQNGAANR